MNWQPYPEVLRETTLGGLEIEVFQPEGIQVVMGASGKPDLEVHVDRLSQENIPLFKRKGGGGTVVLGPGVIVVTVHAGVVHRFRNLGYFKAINQGLIQVFRNWKPLPFMHRGISDIALEGRKLVGTSIFRRKQYLLFQASILVEPDIELIQRLLRHPPREPDYRKGRHHQDFLTDLRTLGINLPISNLIDDLKKGLHQWLPIHLDQVNHLPVEQPTMTAAKPFSP